MKIIRVVHREYGIPTKSVGISKRFQSVFPGQSVSELSGVDVGNDSQKSSTTGVHPYKNLFPWKSRHEFEKDLYNSVVHQDDGLVVVNKPFGVGLSSIYHRSNPDFSNHTRGIGRTSYTLEGATNYLRDVFNEPELTLLKSTEKMTSGIAVYAINKKYADKFKKSLRASKAASHISPVFNYRIITAGVPVTNQTLFWERVGIKLTDTPSVDFRQPVILRQFSKGAVKSQSVIPVYVRAEILKYGRAKTLLLDLKTSTIKWSFLRVYCADLLMPILGDNLYSCRVKTVLGVPTKMNPDQSPVGSTDQSLSQNLLTLLQVDKSIEVPPHIHLKSYSLNNFKGKGKNLVLEAPEPTYYDYTASILNLKLPSKEAV